MKKRHSVFVIFVTACILFPGVFGAVLFGQEGAGKTAHRNARDRLWRSLQEIERDLPKPRADHPGNVFVVGPDVSVKLSQGLSAKAVRWQALDDAGSVVGRGTLKESGRNKGRTIKIGNLGIGWYRVEFTDEAGKVLGWTTAAVVARLAEPTPRDSPICVDSATAWFAPGDATRQERFARLAALAGVNWIRDRMSWGAMHKGPDKFAGNTTYDTAASLQAKYGLKVLQVFHDSPGWAVDKQLDPEGGGRRFTRDLRVLYRFCKAMAERYEGRVLAWEPWNEANIDVFGGHTIDEMCSHQKAAHLGFKAGDPDVTVCWNVYAGSGTQLHTQGVIENESWPYFETYNIHTYRPPEQYVEQFAPAREAACGRPIWISECGVPLPWKTDGSWKELSREDELKQARFIARSYASSMFAGVNRHFFFILGDYAEKKIQFGLLRKDQTPRPGYVALAALGRFLAGARCLGRWAPEEDPSVLVYAFSARPDGKRRDVLVVWSKEKAKWLLPKTVSVEAVYDYLGRSVGGNTPGEIGLAPFYVVLSRGQARKLEIEPPLRSSAYRRGETSRVVLQLRMPHGVTDLGGQAHKVAVEKRSEIEIFAYNFGDAKAKGVVEVERVPAGWELSPRRWEVEVEPMGRRRLACVVGVGGPDEKPQAGWIKLRGDFGDGSRPVLAFRLKAE